MEHLAVPSDHGHPVHHDSWDLQHRLQPFFPEVSANGEWASRERRASERLRRAARIIVGTEVGKAEIASFYQIPTDRIRVLPHPTPRFALESADEQNASVLGRLGIPADYLLYPAQLWPHKNHVNLLLALRLMRDRDGLKIPLVLVGADRGNGDHVRKTIRELDLEGQVFYVGFVPHADLVALYRNAFALAYVSLFGPDNLPPLEAFALGCPVIASTFQAPRSSSGTRLCVSTRRIPRRSQLRCGRCARIRRCAQRSSSVAASGLARLPAPTSFAASSA